MGKPFPGITGVALVDQYLDITHILDGFKQIVWGMIYGFFLILIKGAAGNFYLFSILVRKAIKKYKGND